MKRDVTKLHIAEMATAMARDKAGVIPDMTAKV